MLGTLNREMDSLDHRISTEYCQYFMYHVIVAMVLSRAIL